MAKQQKTKARKKIQEQTSGPNFYGNPSFGGTGNYGMGGYKQLAHYGLNPATQRIAKQEQDEIAANVDRETWSLGKYQTGKMPTPHQDGRNGAVETVAEDFAAITEQAPYDNSTSRMRDLPGFPQMNALVNPKGFVPANDEPRNVDPSTGNKAEYLGPTLNGRQLDPDYESPATSEEIEPAWDKSEDEKELERTLGDEHVPEKEGRPEEQAKDMILHNFISEVLQELLGAPKSTYPSRQGWNNKQLNSLVWRKNHINPENEPPEMWHMLFKDPGGEHNPKMTHGINQANVARKTPAWSFGAIGFPKQHVPEDYEQANPEYEDIIKDPIGSRRLQLPPKGNDMRQATNSSISENTLSETPIDVYSSENDGENDMTGDLDADGSGPDGGAEAFQQSRNEVLKEYIRQLIIAALKEQATVAPKRARPRAAAQQPTVQQIDLNGLRQILAKGAQASHQEASQVIDYVTRSPNLSQDFIAMSEPEIQALEQILDTNIAAERMGPYYNKLETARGAKYFHNQQQQQQAGAQPQQRRPPTAKQPTKSTTQKISVPKQGLSPQFQSVVKQRFDQIKNAPGLSQQQKEKLVAQLGRIQLAPEGTEDLKLRQINDLIKSNIGTSRTDMPTPAAPKQIRPAQVPQQGQSSTSLGGNILSRAKSMLGLNEALGLRSLSLTEALEEEEEE